jgi:uncharacterized protein (TIGR01777 family)
MRLGPAEHEEPMTAPSSPPAGQPNPPAGRPAQSGPRVTAPTPIHLAPRVVRKPGGDGPASVLISGASGLIGTALARALRGEGARVVRLVRRPASGPDEISWTPGEKLDPGLLAGIEAAVNLSGAGVGDRRWTASYQRTLVTSRIETTRTLSEAIAATGGDGPKVLVSGSAVGYYGNAGDAELDESAPSGTGFFAQLCRDWEAATAPADNAARVVHVRTGIVLSPHGGLLGKQSLLFKLGLGGRLGSGRQYLPWISLRDEVAAIRFALASSSVSGALNAVAPQALTNREFTAALAAAVHRPAFVPVPAFALRLALGGFADEGALTSERVVPAVLQRSEFAFADSTVESALDWALRAGRAR